MTPLEENNGLYFKREDLNPSGSVKDRWLSQTINPNHQYVISSSGNAAISAQFYNPSVVAFVSSKINPSKLKLIKNYNLSLKPVSDAFKYAKNSGFTLLRQSSDPLALNGYSQIATELLRQLPGITSLFLPVGSGTTLLGISQNLPLSVKIFAVQPSSHCPIASVFDHNYTPEPTTITDALSVKLLPLKNKVITAISSHRGSGVVVQNQSAIDCQTNNYSAETALTLAGYYKIKNTMDTGNFPVILVTGVKR